MRNSSIAIELTNISKNYSLYQSPNQRVKETFHPFGKKYSTTFQALNNISVKIGFGETVGILGRNGCGKSTLLQIVCGILTPSFGTRTVNGRISAILELGAGFNPEFSGRDNIYLNCSILGMERYEIDDRYDSILEFADIGEFIDRPVKTYSSGMAIRLAFSIAINVDPAILVVDEALSVGDAAFQRKCFARIKSIQEKGATILFVSHDAGSVIELCDRAILLDNGDLLCSGHPKEVVALYHKLLFAPPEKIDNIRRSILSTDTPQNRTDETIQEQDILEQKIIPASNAHFNEHLKPKSTTWYEPNGAQIDNLAIQTLNGRKVNVLVSNEEYHFCYSVQFLKSAFGIRFCMLIKTLRGFEIGGYGNRVENTNESQHDAGTVVNVKLRFRCSLLPGMYFLNAGVLGVCGKVDGYLHRGVDVLMFEVMQEKSNGSTGVVDFRIQPEIILYPTTNSNEA